VLEICEVFFKRELKNKDDNLILEIMLYLIEFYKFLLGFFNLHAYIN